VIRVLIVDDNALVRAGVVAVLSRTDGIEVVAECADGDVVPGVAAWVQPDVVLMDMRMPVTSDMDATRSLHARLPTIKVVMMTASPIGGSRQDAARAGAVGYLLKSGDSISIVEAIRAVAAGGTAWFDPPDCRAPRARDDRPR
jgi:DNA-binding NarL/FixJ family response regulator